MSSLNLKRTAEVHTCSIMRNSDNLIEWFHSYMELHHNSHVRVKEKEMDGVRQIMREETVKKHVF